MENDIKVSVIVPLYNRAKFLPQLFNTLNSQTFKNFEVILVDDGSTDDTKDWLAKNSKAIEQNVLYLYQENAGPYAARNTGLAKAQGQFIAFQDSDDEWPEYHLKEMVEDLEVNPDIDWLFGSLRRIDHDSGVIKEESNFLKPDGKKQEFLQLRTNDRGRVKVIDDENAGQVAIRFAVPGSTQCALIRKRVFDEHIFDASYRTAYDRFFAIKLVLLGYKFAYVEKVHQIYHIHNDHISLVAGASATKLEKSARTMIRGYTEMISCANSQSEIKEAKIKLSEVYAWELGISLQSQGRFIESSKCFFKALLLNPFKPVYIKSLVASYVKAVVHIAKRYFGQNEPAQ